MTCYNRVHKITMRREHH